MFRNDYTQALTASHQQPNLAHLTNLIFSLYLLPLSPDIQKDTILSRIEPFCPTSLMNGLLLSRFLVSDEDLMAKLAFGFPPFMA